MESNTVSFLNIRSSGFEIALCSAGLDGRFEAAPRVAGLVEIRLADQGDTEEVNFFHLGTSSSSYLVCNWFLIQYNEFKIVSELRNDTVDATDHLNT